jgi:hypothetical protein
MRVRFSPVPLSSGTLRGFQTSREGARRAKPGGSPRGWGHRPAGGRQTGSLETRVRFPVTPLIHFHGQRAGRKPVSKTSSAGFEPLAACNGERPWLGHGQAGNLCEPSGFRFDSDALLTWKVNAAGPRTASKAEGAPGLGVRFARLPRRVARTVRGRSAKPKPVVVSPEQVRLLHSPLSSASATTTSWPRGEVPVCKTGNAGSIPAEVSEVVARPRCQWLHA